MAENTQKDNSGQGPVIDLGILAREKELLGTKAGSAGATSTQGTSQASSAQTSNTGLKPEQFNIPAIVKEKYPELIKLVLETESMDNEERDYWFQMVPIMTNDQIQKLKEILISEKEQLAKLDAEYEAELKKIDEKQLNEWKEFEMKQKKEEIEKNEAQAQASEEATEEELLKKLQNL